MLSSLLERLETATAEVRENSQLHPPFEVLQLGENSSGHSGIRFVAEDIRNRAAQTSS